MSSFQGGTVAIMCAMERPHFFTGIVLSAPAILANPETATPFMVNQVLTTVIRTAFGSYHSNLGGVQTTPDVEI